MRRTVSIAALVMLMFGWFASPATGDVAIRRVDGKITTTVELLPSGLAIHGIGTLTSLGPVTAESTQTVSGDPLNPQPGARIFSNDLVITSMSTGDELHGGYSLRITSVNSSGLAFSGWIWFTGGTGVYQRASGGGPAEGGFSFQAQAGYYTIRTLVASL